MKFTRNVVFAVLVLLGLILLAYFIQLSRRPVINNEVLKEALRCRSESRCWIEEDDGTC